MIFSTKQKSSLKWHLNRNRNRMQITLFECFTLAKAFKSNCFLLCNIWKSQFMNKKVDYYEKNQINTWNISNWCWKIYCNQSKTSKKKENGNSNGQTSRNTIVNKKKDSHEIAVNVNNLFTSIFKWMAKNTHTPPPPRTPTTQFIHGICK